MTRAQNEAGSQNDHHHAGVDAADELLPLAVSPVRCLGNAGGHRGLVRKAGIPFLVAARHVEAKMMCVLADTFAGDDEGMALRMRCGKPAAIPSHAIVQASCGPTPLVTPTMVVHHGVLAPTVSSTNQEQGATASSERGATASSERVLVCRRRVALQNVGTPSRPRARRSPFSTVESKGWNKNMRLDGASCIAVGCSLNEPVEDRDSVFYVFRMPRPTGVAGLNGMKQPFAEIRGLLRMLARHTDRAMRLCTARAARWGIPNHHAFAGSKPQHSPGKGSHGVEL